MDRGRELYCHRDDDPHLVDDALAGKVLRYIQYVTLIDTSRLSVVAVGRTIILNGLVDCEAEVGAVEEAAAAVIGVHLIENNVEVLRH